MKSHVTMVIHMYTKKSTSSSTKQWGCSKRTALSCIGKTTTDIDVSRVGVLSEFGNWGIFSTGILSCGDFVMDLILIMQVLVNGPIYCNKDRSPPPPLPPRCIIRNRYHPCIPVLKCFSHRKVEIFLNFTN